MAAENQFTIQIGTAFDNGQELIWTLKKEATSHDGGLIIPRPRKYRRELAKMAHAYEDTPAGTAKLQELLGVELGRGAQQSRCFLSVKELMQSGENFCPEGKWFRGLGERAARYCGLFSPSPLRIMISLRNPAALLSDAWSSGNYAGFDAVAPDPFDLSWADVLNDVRACCPDVPVIAWPAEESPLIWHQVLHAATQKPSEVPLAAGIHLAERLMTEEGGQRLAAYLEQHQDLPPEKRSRAVALFLDKFKVEDTEQDNLSIPGWNQEKQRLMQEHYAADLEKVSKIEGVTLLTA
ncbi:hypothetical protein OS190_13865 [Sulfitobacter sp. F26204]|uniref:hypothetical protein n=1 Tax=Sulfitobacter sp. F26204 TaxID=2996014 RepID=UPI00225E0D64|nr:hypothetical protein [Sulfitobacter sp. F26204]MCX7560660.1 hypothetical protein [Sulfitobacter sp. F26204]